MNAIASGRTEADIRAKVRLTRATDRQEALKRAATVGRDHGVQDGIDYGPALRQADEERVETDKDILRERRPDIDDPAEYKREIRGGRRRDGLLLMWRRKDLTDAQMAGAERFRDDLAIAAGARLSIPGEVSVRSQRTSSSYHPSMVQIDAHSRAHAAWRTVPERCRPVLSWVVISWGTLGGYETCRHMRNGRARPWLIDALDAIADFYTVEPQRR